MCGINGVVLTGGAAAGEDDLRRTIRGMNAALAHRGPDGEGEFWQPGVVLGHRRLAILDLSEAGRQPMFNEDGSLALVFNGEIYNYLELIPELKAAGHVFRSHSDSEVILHAYEQWGEACVERLNGMWAFAIWDVRKRELFMSRDRFGVKPFYYWQDTTRFVFSSEPAGIIAAQPLREANLAKLHAYLAYGYRTTNGETFFAGLNELLPGHCARLESSGRLHLRRFWQLPRPPMAAPSPSERVEAYRALLVDAVRLRFRSDVPVALLQSGGLDSSAICAVVNDEIEAGRLGPTEITAFTSVYPGEAEDESAAIDALMATCPHVRSVQLSPNGDELAGLLPEFVRTMQEPVASSTSFAHWRLMKAVHQRGIKVVINGQGADEALAGYGRYVVGYRLLDLLQTRPTAAWTEAKAMRSKMGFGLPQLAMQTAKAMLGRRSASSFRARFSEGTTAVLDTSFHRTHQGYLPDVVMQHHGRNMRNHLRSQLLDYGFNQILHYEDQSSMSQAVEIRSPFIDYRLMEYAFALPDEDLLSDGVTKRVLRTAFASRLPLTIVDNHRKIGFATPFDIWARTPAFRLMTESIVHSPEFCSRGLWDSAKLAKRLLDPGAARQGFAVWRFINTELWLRAFGITNA